jgi:hypothetical protein
MSHSRITESEEKCKQRGVMYKIRDTENRLISVVRKTRMMDKVINLYQPYRYPSE